MDKDLNHILYHLGEEHSRYYNAVAPPIIQSSIFSFDSIEEFKKSINSESRSHVYGRGNNPTVEILRRKIAALEGAEDALVVSSGAAAMSLAVLSCLSHGDHVICVRNPYSWTHALTENYIARFGMTHSYVEGDNLDEIKGQIKSNTKLLILETPNSLTFGIQDLRACAAIAKEHSITTIVDNSCSTPLFQNPISFGIDIVIHSMSKYINGHSDVVAGAICSSHEHIERIFYNEYMTLGPALSPNDAALIIRGLRTLPLRMERIQQTTRELISYFKSSRHFKDVYYPLDPDSPQYELAAQQMTGCGGLVTVAINAPSIEKMNTFANSLKVFKLAVSWGGPESLVLPMSALYGLEGRQDPDVAWNVARMSVGLEDSQQLIGDIEQAVRKAGL